MKSYFLVRIAQPHLVESTLNELLPGQMRPWLLLHQPEDPIAYVHVHAVDEIHVDMSGRHNEKDAAVLRVLEQLQARVGGIIENDD